MSKNNNGEAEARIAINNLYLEKIHKIKKLKPEFSHDDGSPNKKRIVESALDIYYDHLLKIAIREQKLFSKK